MHVIEYLKQPTVIPEKWKWLSAFVFTTLAKTSAIAT